MGLLDPARYPFYFPVLGSRLRKATNQDGLSMEQLLTGRKSSMQILCS